MLLQNIHLALQCIHLLPQNKRLSTLFYLTPKVLSKLPQLHILFILPLTAPFTAHICALYTPRKQEKNGLSES